MKERPLQKASKLDVAPVFDNYLLVLKTQVHRLVWLQSHCSISRQHIGPTISNLASLSRTVPVPLSRTPKNMPDAFCGTSGTTSYFFHSVVPLIDLSCILSKASCCDPLSIYAHPRTRPIFCAFCHYERTETDSFPPHSGPRGGPV